MNRSVVALFSGCGGLDLGFAQAGFNIAWANEYDKNIWETYEKNHIDTILDKRDIRNILTKEIPDCIGIIGGPPCQSWSEGGAQRGMEDDRGQLFLDYIRILEDKQPLFFLAENVSGMLHQKHNKAFNDIKNSFQNAGYSIACQLINAKDYGIPQDRKRVIIVGYRNDLGKKFDFNLLRKTSNVLDLRNTIWDLRDSAIPALETQKTNGKDCTVANHEYMIGDFSSIYMSRNRVRLWDEPSFTIQAGGRQAPIHPQANRMISVGKDKRIFDSSSPYPYRRLSVRECARIQTFPDDFKFYYNNLADGYKMIGNAVPVDLACAIAKIIKMQVFRSDVSDIQVVSSIKSQDLKDLSLIF
jgi:DNA (cytosine-5)-methyltransferase 1